MDRVVRYFGLPGSEFAVPSMSRGTSLSQTVNETGGALRQARAEARYLGQALVTGGGDISAYLKCLKRLPWTEQRRLTQNLACGVSSEVYRELVGRSLYLVDSERFDGSHAAACTMDVLFDDVLSRYPDLYERIVEPKANGVVVKAVGFPNQRLEVNNPEKGPYYKQTPVLAMACAQAFLTPSIPLGKQSKAIHGNSIVPAALLLGATAHELAVIYDESIEYPDHDDLGKPTSKEAILADEFQGTFQVTGAVSKPFVGSSRSIKQLDKAQLLEHLYEVSRDPQKVLIRKNVERDSFLVSGGYFDMGEAPDTENAHFFVVVELPDWITSQ